MAHRLLQAVRSHLRLHADPSGLARTPIAGLTTLHAAAPTCLHYSLSGPRACLVLQGAGRVATDGRASGFDAGDTVLVTADVPIVSEVTRATPSAPFLAIVMEFDAVVIAELALEMEVAPDTAGTPLRSEPTHPEVIEAALRLMRLFERPASVPVLGAQLVRELHYWLLTGPNGGAIGRLGRPDDHGRRVARALAMLRADFAKAIPVERLAAEAGMSLSSFRQHFRAATTLSPLQFQKHLRLIEARRLMQARGMTASNAAVAVGYDSVPQFTREYRRMFGLPPMRDMLEAMAGTALLPANDVAAARSA